MYLSKGTRQKGKERTDTFCAPCVGAPWSKDEMYLTALGLSEHHREWPTPTITDTEAQRSSPMIHPAPTHRHRGWENLNGAMTSARGLPKGC